MSDVELITCKFLKNECNSCKKASSHFNNNHQTKYTGTIIKLKVYFYFARMHHSFLIFFLLSVGANLKGMQTYKILGINNHFMGYNILTDFSKLIKIPSKNIFIDRHCYDVEFNDASVRVRAE